MSSLAGRVSGSSHKKGRRGSRIGDSISYQDDRGHWGSRAEFLLSCLGLSVGLGNLWRFPYIAYENGGGAFMIPYLILLTLIGRPIYLMDVSLGQYSQLGPVHTYTRATPLMAGLGYAMLLRSFVSGSSYMVIISYSLHYIFKSVAYIGNTLPWSVCAPTLPPDQCYVVGEQSPCRTHNLSGPGQGVDCTTATATSAEVYWRQEVIDIHPEGIRRFGEMGGIHIPLFLCLIVGWIIVGLCMMKGIRSAGKVVYVTATLPFLIMAVMMAAGLQLEGARKGLYFLFVPEWKKLLDIHVWRKAMEQCIYSLSIGGGALLTFGSYNDFNNKVHIDVMILAFMDLVASLMSSITIFSVLGAMAHELGHENIKDVVASGPGLAFITYPEAITRTLPLPHLWCVLFFVMVFTLGLDSMFGSMENIVTTVTDEYPRMRKHKPTVVAIICVCMCAIGIPYVTRKGPYLFYLVDVYFTGAGGLLFCLLSTVAVHWVYGVQKFAEDMKFMLNYKPSSIIKFSWAVLAPITLLALFVGSLIRWDYPVYQGKHHYPSWLHTIGGALPIIVIAPVIIMALSHVMDKLWIGKARKMLRPSSLWGPGCPVARQRLRENKRIAQQEQWAADNNNTAYQGKHNPGYESTML